MLYGMLFVLCCACVRRFVDVCVCLRVTYCAMLYGLRVCVCFCFVCVFMCQCDVFVIYCVLLSGAFWCLFAWASGFNVVVCQICERRCAL